MPDPDETIYPNQLGLTICNPILLGFEGKPCSQYEGKCKY